MSCDAPSTDSSESSVIFGCVEGRDVGYRPLSSDEIEQELNDPWALLVLRKGVFPATLEEALSYLDTLPRRRALANQASYMVAEGGQIPFSEAPLDLARGFRLVVTRGDKENFPILINSPSPGASRSDFLELIAWDAKKEAFNFYRRILPRTWVWRGESMSAFETKSMGKGCFACHINGAPIMKELNRPWNNWHSQAAGIREIALPPGDPLLQNSLFRNRSGAQDLERHIEAMISNLNAERVRRAVTPGGDIKDLRVLLRPLFLTTTVNLASSVNESAGTTAELLLPPNFFLNFGALAKVIAIDGVFQPRVLRRYYADALKDFNARLMDQESGFVRPGDTYFAFLVPEPSFEDVDMIQALLGNQIISPHFAASVLMVDMQNPIYSPSRERLYQYVPTERMVSPVGGDTSTMIAASIRKEAKKQGACRQEQYAGCSPEQQFILNWDLPEDRWRTVLSERVNAYLRSVSQRLKTKPAYYEYFKLAHSRRQELRASRHKSLVESRILFPVIDPSGAVLEMKTNAKVGRKKLLKGEKENV